MKGAFDASILLLAIDERALPPARENADPAGARDRVEYLIETLDAQRSTIVIPTPALSELLVRGGPEVSELLELLDATPRLEFADFGRRAAIECGLMLRKRWQSGKKKGLGESWPKAKFDHQIVAVAKVYGAEIIYSDDRGVQRLAKATGSEPKASGICRSGRRPLNESCC